MHTFLVWKIALWKPYQTDNKMSMCKKDSDSLYFNQKAVFYP